MKKNKTKARLLCPDCGILSELIHENERQQFFLACRHVRPIGLLPKRHGSVGLEDIVANSRLASKHFPPMEKRIDEINRLLTEASALGAKEGLAA